LLTYDAQPYRAQQSAGVVVGDGIKKRWRKPAPARAGWSAVNNWACLILNTSDTLVLLVTTVTLVGGLVVRQSAGW